MKVVALDISSKTGFAVFIDAKLSSFGLLKNDKKVADYGSYPFNYLLAAKDMATKMLEFIEKEKPDILVIESLNLGKSRWSNHYLEMIHCVLLYHLFIDKFPGKIIYLDSSMWRHTLGQKASKEDRKNNAKVNKAAKEGVSKKSLGLVGKRTPKHRSVEYANKTFNLNLKIGNNDISDAICLGWALIQGATPSEGK